MGILTAWFIFIRFCCFLIKKKSFASFEKNHSTGLAAWKLGAWDTWEGLGGTGSFDGGQPGRGRVK